MYVPFTTCLIFCPYLQRVQNFPTLLFVKRPKCFRPSYIIDNKNSRRINGDYQIKQTDVCVLLSNISHIKSPKYDYMYDIPFISKSAHVRHNNQMLSFQAIFDRKDIEKSKCSHLLLIIIATPFFVDGRLAELLKIKTTQIKLFLRLEIQIARFL